MERTVDDILQEALELPPAARAAIAGSLIASLEPESDDDAETAWEAEIARRIEQIDRGDVTMISWEEARPRIIGG
jgi:putative addiction module component (TIGR02574 family)